MAFSNVVQVRIPPEILKALQDRATSEGHTLSSMVRHILVQVLKEGSQ